MDRAIATDVGSPGGRPAMNIRSIRDIKFLIGINGSTEGELSKVLATQQTHSQENLDISLISACDCGYEFLAYELVHLGADVHTRDKDGNTPLLICVEKGLVKTARFFIDEQADFNSANYCGNTALIIAVGVSVEMVRLLLSYTGINTNHQNKEGYTALMQAVEAKNVDIIRLLLESHKNTAAGLHKIRNCRHETAQNIADRLGIGKVVKFLSEPDGEPIMGAIRTCDVDSFNILLDCQLYDSTVKTVIVERAFQRIFRKHQKIIDEFSASEEDFVERLLELGANVYDRYQGMDPIFIATRAGSFKVLQLLLERVTKSDLYVHGRRMDPLRVAAENGRLDLLQLLCQNSPVSQLKYSHLECALKNGHSDCARFFVKQGVIIDVNIALTMAVESQLPVHVKFLIENYQARVKTFALTKDMDNLLVTACRYGNVEIISLLLDVGANVNCANELKKTPLMEAKNPQVIHYLVKRGAFVRQNSTPLLDYYSPLLYILSKDYDYPEFSIREAVIEALLKCGAYADVKDSVGRTPLMLAVTNCESRNIVEMLMQFGAKCSMTDIQGNTPLLLAVEANNMGNILCVLQFCSNNTNILNIQNCNGFTPLMVASKNNNLEVVNMLLQKGADVSLTDVSGNTALLHASTTSLNYNRNILISLIAAGSNINHQNNSGLSPLMLAAENFNKTDVIKLLVQAGAEVNSLSKKFRDRTALSVLSYQRSLDKKTLDCMTYLLDQGARASYVSPDIIHKLILLNSVHLIPKLIDCGMGPSLVTFVHPDNSGIVSFMSPLCTALLTKSFHLFHYFIANLFLTKSDICFMLYHKPIRDRLQSTPIHGLLTKISSQPMSLFTLAFVSVQTVVGCSPGREERINRLPLPRLIKDRLLFKREDVVLDK